MRFLCRQMVKGCYWEGGWGFLEVDCEGFCARLLRMQVYILVFGILNDLFFGNRRKIEKIGIITDTIVSAKVKLEWKRKSSRTKKNIL